MWQINTIIFLEISTCIKPLHEICSIVISVQKQNSINSFGREKQLILSIYSEKNAIFFTSNQSMQIREKCRRTMLRLSARKRSNEHKNFIKESLARSMNAKNVSKRYCKGSKIHWNALHRRSLSSANSLNWKRITTDCTNKIHLSISVSTSFFYSSHWFLSSRTKFSYFIKKLWMNDDWLFPLMLLRILVQKKPPSPSWQAGCVTPNELWSQNKWARNWSNGIKLTTSTIDKAWKLNYGNDVWTMIFFDLEMVNDVLFTSCDLSFTWRVIFFSSLRLH